MVGEDRSLERLVNGAAARITRWEAPQAFSACGADGMIIDIRSQDACDLHGVIPGSVHIPRTVLEWRIALHSPWRNRHLGRLDQQLILICDHGIRRFSPRAISSSLASTEPVMSSAGSRPGSPAGSRSRDTSVDSSGSGRYLGWARLSRPLVEVPQGKSLDRDHVEACGPLAQPLRILILGRFVEPLRRLHIRELEEHNALGLPVALQHRERAAAGDEPASAGCHGGGRGLLSELVLLSVMDVGLDNDVGGHGHSSQLGMSRNSHTL